MSTSLFATIRQREFGNLRVSGNTANGKRKTSVRFSRNRRDAEIEDIDHDENKNETPPPKDEILNAAFVSSPVSEDGAEDMMVLAATESTSVAYASLHQRQLKDIAEAPLLMQPHPSAFSPEPIAASLRPVLASFANGPRGASMTSIVAPNQERRAVLAYITDIQFENHANPHLIAISSSDGLVEIHDFEQLRANVLSEKQCSTQVKSTGLSALPRTHHRRFSDDLLPLSNSASASANALLRPMGLNTKSLRLCLDVGPRLCPSMIRWAPSSNGTLLLGMRWSSKVWGSNLETCSERSPCFELWYSGKNVLDGCFVSKDIAVLGGRSGGVQWFDIRRGGQAVQSAVLSVSSLGIRSLCLSDVSGNVVVAASQSGHLTTLDARMTNQVIAKMEPVDDMIPTRSQSAPFSGNSNTASFSIVKIARVGKEWQNGNTRRSLIPDYSLFNLGSSNGNMAAKAGGLAEHHAEAISMTSEPLFSESEACDWLSTIPNNPHEVIFRTSQGRLGTLDPMSLRITYLNDQQTNGGLNARYSGRVEERRYFTMEQRIEQDTMERLARRVYCQKPGIRQSPAGQIDVFTPDLYSQTVRIYSGAHLGDLSNKDHPIPRFSQVHELAVSSVPSCVELHPFADLAVVGYANNQVQVFGSASEF